MSLVEIDASCLERVQKILKNVPGGAEKATSAALKRAGETAKTKAGQFVAMEYTIPKGVFMGHVHVSTQSSNRYGGLTLDIKYTSTPLSLITFKTKASKNGGVSVQVLRNGGGGRLEHAFQANIGAMEIFERVGTERFPVRTFYGPGPSKMMGNSKVVELMDKTITETFEKRIEHEIMRILSMG